MKPFHFKKFSIEQDQCAMKVTFDACLFGALCASELNDDSKDHIALDIGSGTGLLSLMLAQKGLKHVYGVELDHAAAQQSQNNVLNSPYSNKITITEGNIEDYRHHEKFNLIVSNPPFFSQHLKGPNHQRNQARHNDGLSFKTLIFYIQQNLAINGFAWLLLPCDEYERFKEQLKSAKLSIHNIHKVRSREDKAPHRVMFSLTHCDNKSRLDMGESNLKIETYTIHQSIDDQSVYSQKVQNLLRDYYLKL